VPRPEFIKNRELSELQVAWQQMTELLSAQDRPTAVLAANDLTAIGGMRAANEDGLLDPGRYVDRRI